MPTHVISANGIGPNSTTGDVQIPIYQSKTIITDAQIKALPTTFVELVPDVPEGKMPMLHSGFITIESTAGAYTKINAADSYLAITLKKGADLWHDLSYPKVNAGMNAFSGGHVFFTFLPRAIYDDTSVTAFESINFTVTPANISGSGLAVTIWNGSNGDLTGGNAANSMEITVFYSIVDL